LSGRTSALEQACPFGDSRARSTHPGPGGPDANPPAVACLLESYRNRPMTLTGYVKPRTFIALEAFDTIT